MKNINIRYTAIAPVSHIGESASTGSYFQTVQTASGRVPVITGNSIRGQIRDSMASHLLDTVDTKVSRDVFNILFSGGNVNDSMKDDVEKAKQVREHFPMVSLLGGGLGTMIMAGKLISGFAYPICRETEGITGVQSNVSWHNLIDEIEFTRMDDAKNDLLAQYLKDASEEKTAKASTQMRFSVQYVALGAQFSQDLYLLDGVTELEVGALFAGLAKWFEVPKLGGMSAKGFGLFNATVIYDGEQVLSRSNGEITKAKSVEKLVSDYEDFLHTEGSKYFDLLQTKEKKGNGKKAVNTD